MSAISAALSRVRAVSNSAYAQSVHLKKAGTLPDIFDNAVAGLGSYAQFAEFQDQGANKQRYSQYRGWVYSAVNALAMKAAMQPFQIGRKVSKAKPKGTKDYGLQNPLNLLKEFQLKKMPGSIRSKSYDANIELLTEHPFHKVLHKPNSMQHGYQFVYSFVANLCLTGWGYVIGGVNEDGDPEIYSVPTTWVTPDHTTEAGAFGKFWIQNPKNPVAGRGIPIDRENVEFAYLPNPTDPLMALAPANAQMLAIKVDDHIQTSQAAFFENSVFPGAIVTMGKQPHPDVPGGIRPRLTPAQRRQVYGAIKKVMSGVSNYGNPAIVDGMIESIERLSATQNEIGWEKSEKSVRTRILSAFAVHPFILGEEMAGSYAQAYVVGERFCDRVNVFLALLSQLMTNFVPVLLDKSSEKAANRKTEANDDLVVWWEEAQVKDPSMEKSLWEAARQRGDVSQNEFRAWMGIGPDEDGDEAAIDKTNLQAVTGIAAQVTAGTLQADQAKGILRGLGLPKDLINDIVGDGPAVEEDTGYADDGSSMGDVGDGIDTEEKSVKLLDVDSVIKKSLALSVEVLR